MNQRAISWMRASVATLAGVVLHAIGMAQPVCSIQIDNDTTICQGQSVTLHGPAGYTNYLWNTGASTQNITASSTGTYWCQVTYPTGNLVTNGNFSGGNTGFTTQFSYQLPLTTDGNYWIGTNAATYHPQWAATGNGPFLIVNAGWMHAGWRFWCQTIDVCPGQTYNLQFRATSLATQGNPTLTWFVNNNWTFQDHITSPVQGLWQTFNTSWTAPPGVTTADFCLQVSSGHGIGNDFGIDDIAISSNVVLRDSVDVTVTPLPAFNLGPDVTLCDGQTLNLDANVPGATYLWQDGSTASTYSITSPGTYGVTVTANGCSASDVIDVGFNPLPVVDLGPDLTLCDGETVTLDVTQPGATYLWQNGSTAPTFTVNAPGTYSVGVLLNNCSNVDAVDVAYNPLPVVNLGPDLSFCAGGQAVLDATTAGATYLWSDGSSGATLAVNATGTYDVDVTVNGCTSNDAVDVNVIPLPVFDIGPDQVVCPGTAVTLDATTPGATYLWSDGSTGATLTTSTPGAYSVDVTVNGCTSTDAMNLSNHVLPVFSLGPDQTICQGALAHFGAAVPGASYQWSTGASADSLHVGSAGTYWLDVTTNGCTVRDSIDVLVTPLPVVSLGNDFDLCPGVNATLDVTTAGGSYLWSTGAVAPAISVSPGSYDVQVTVNGCSSSDAITIGSYPAAQVDLGGDLLLCPGDQQLLDVSQAGASYLWNDGSSAATYLVQSAGAVSVQLTDANGCTASDAINVVYAAPVPVNLGPDATICAGDAITLDATTPGASYLWSTGASTATISVSTAGNYNVVVTQGSCTVTDDIDISVAPLPVVDLGPDQTLCTGDQITLDATALGVSYLWSTGAATPSITVTQGGTYSVTLTNAANCSASDAVDIIEATPDAIDLGPDATICQGQSLVLDATLPGATYSWSTGAGTPTLSVSAAGTYWVEATQGQCAVSDTITVSVQANPTVNLGADLTLCAGDAATLDATNAGATYQWSTGETTPTIGVNAAGTYDVVVDLNGCTAADAIDIAVLDLGALDLGADVTLCDGETVTFTAVLPGVNLSWSTGANTPSITTGTAGTYWVEASQGACSVSDTVVVNVLPAPSVDLGADLTLCAGDTATLDATNAGATYQWSTGETTPTIGVNAAGTYDVVVDLNGCTATDAIDIAVLDLGALDLGADVTLCDGETVTFTAVLPGVNLSWSTGANTPSITTGTAGTYWVEASQGACSVSDTVVVNVLPAPSVDLGADLTLCAGDAATLDATNTGATYQWSTGETTPTISANSAGTYNVVVDLNGCTATDTIDIAVLDLGALDLGADATLCDGETVTFTVVLPGVNLNWSSGANTPSITTGTAGTYWIEASQGACSVSDTVVVNVLPAPSVDLGADLTLCAGDAATLDATNAGATYQWSTGETTPTISVNDAGTYNVVVDLNGCTATDAMTVDVVTPASFDLGPDVTLCAGDQVVFALGIAGADYLWSTGSTASTVTINSTSTVWVQVDQSVCSASDTVQVIVVEPGAIDLGTDITACEGTPIVLDATLPGASYLWSTGATSAQLTVTSSGTYSVTATVAQCTATDEIEVTINPLPVVDLGGDQSICPGASASFDASTPGASYLWQDGSTGATYTASDAEPVSVTVTVNGCSAADQAAIIVLPTPIAALGNDTTLCEGASLLLDVAQQGASYLWNDGSIGPALLVTQAGSYSVTVDLNGCTNSDAIDVEVFVPSTLELGPDQLHCPGEQVALATGIAGNHLWSTGSTGSAITVSSAGTYWVRVQVAACVVSDTVRIDYVPLITPDLGPDLTLCEGDSAVLAVDAGDASIAWSTGSVNDSLVVHQSGIYTVTLELQGCTASDAARIRVLEWIDSITLGNDSTWCTEQPLVLDVTTPGASYQWSTGATSSSISIQQDGLYSVQLTGLCIDAYAEMLVTEGVCDPLIYVPNSFTPNGDGVNEVFGIAFHGPHRDFTLDIFDRWGERIVSLNDPTMTWDGTMGGTPVPDGVYVWKIRYRATTDGGARARELIGHVTVLR